VHQSLQLLFWRGVYKGRQKKINDEKILELTAQGHSQNQVAELMGITRMSVYRCLKKQKVASGYDLAKT